MSTIATNSMELKDHPQYRAYMEFGMVPNEILGSRGLASFTDLGTGLPQFNLTNFLKAPHGHCHTISEQYTSGGNDHRAVTDGGIVDSTQHWRAYTSGSSAAEPANWYRGSTGLFT